MIFVGIAYLDKQMIKKSLPWWQDLQLILHQNFVYVNTRPSRLEDSLDYKTHQKVLKMNIRPSYNREITVGVI